MLIGGPLGVHRVPVLLLEPLVDGLLHVPLPVVRVDLLGERTVPGIDRVEVAPIRVAREDRQVEVLLRRRDVLRAPGRQQPVLGCRDRCLRPGEPLDGLLEVRERLLAVLGARSPDALVPLAGFLVLHRRRIHLGDFSTASMTWSGTLRDRSSAGSVMVRMAWNHWCAWRASCAISAHRDANSAGDGWSSMNASRGIEISQVVSPCGPTFGRARSARRWWARPGPGAGR